jgi:hypothetical protein
MIKWVHTMLGSQHIVTAQMDCRFRISVDLGCMQRGVLSLMLCSLVMDGFLAWLNREGHYTQGCADVLALLVTEKFPSTTTEFMQRALNIVSQDCECL